MDIIDKAPLIRKEKVENIIDCNSISVQVAGTNGKGSTCAFLSSILRSHGKSVGLYVSPHITDICERISIDGEYISYNLFETLVCGIDKRQKGMCKSDLMFFAAVEYFNANKVDYAVFETGMGGTRDSATLIDHKYGVIAQIGLDHTKYLGDTIEAITREKAGIVKAGMEVVAYPNSTNHIIEQVCRENHARFVNLLKGEFSIENDSFSFSYDNEEYKNISLLMKGNFQAYNCACALICAKNMLKDEFDKAKAVAAVESTSVFGRISTLRENPRMITDVAHNPDGIKALCNYTDGFNGKKCAVVSIPSTKDYKAMMTVLKEHFHYIVAFRADEKACDPNLFEADTIAHSFSEIEKSICGYDLTVFCGSFAMTKLAKKRFCR